MKKTLIIGLTVLLGLFVVFTVMDKSDYALEKRLWRVQKDFTELSQDPQSAPAEQYASLARRYRRLIEKYPDSRLVPMIYLQISRLYFMQEAYDRARDILQELKDRYPDRNELQAEALLYIGNAYESEGDFSQAVKTYQKIQQRYPHTEWGIGMPLYLADVYLRAGKLDEHRQALENAAAYYRGIVADEGADLGHQLRAYRSLVAAYLAQEKWNDAVSVLKNALFRYAKSEYLTPRSAGVLIRSIAQISVTRLENPDRAIGIYQEFIREHPDHPLSPTLKKLIAAMQQQGVTQNGLPEGE
ncbi:MAG: tetratricopeptide repeat protein [Candidatus Omnitrophota bacterium]